MISNWEIFSIIYSYQAINKNELIGQAGAFRNTVCLQGVSPYALYRASDYISHSVNNDCQTFCCIVKITKT
jgi:hypothetical protein